MEKQEKVKLEWQDPKLEVLSIDETEGKNTSFTESGTAGPGS